MAKVSHSARFEELKARYERGGCTEAQLRAYTRLNIITPEEFKEITGKDY